MRTTSYKLLFGLLFFISLVGCRGKSLTVDEATGVGSNPEYRGSWAQVPVILSRITAPSFPNRALIITDKPYSAAADGSVDAREAIQRAIVDLSRYGGGKLIIPKGTFFVDGPLNLESNVNLHLEAGSELSFGTDYEKYLPQVLTRYEGTDVYNFSPLIYAYQKKNIAITGLGTITGNAAESWSTWVDKAAHEDLKRIPGSSKMASEQASRNMNNQDTPLFERAFDESDKLRPSFMLFYNSENILIEGVKIIDSPFWVNHFYMSKNITVRNMVMTSFNKNNDGIDIESSEDVHIHDVDFSTGDDCISIKSGRDLEGLHKMIPSKNIVVQNVRFLADDAVALGSEASGGVRNVFVENSIGENLRKGFYFKANNNRGSHFEHIRIRNLTFGDLADVPENRRKLNMIEVTTNYDSAGVVYDRPPEFKDIRFENLTGGSSIYPLKLEGTKQSLLRDFVFDDVDIGVGEQPNIIKDTDFESMFFRNMTVAGEPLKANLDGSDTATQIVQTNNTPPDVYAGEEQIVQLSNKNTIWLRGDAVDVENDSLIYIWEAVPAASEGISIGEDTNGDSITFAFADENAVSFSNPDGLSTQVTFDAPGIYRLRLNVNDGLATGYHTVFTEVRR